MHWVEFGSSLCPYVFFYCLPEGTIGHPSWTRIFIRVEFPLPFSEYLLFLSAPLSLSLSLSPSISLSLSLSPSISLPLSLSLSLSLFLYPSLSSGIVCPSSDISRGFFRVSLSLSLSLSPHSDSQRTKTAIVFWGDRRKPNTFLV